MIQKINLAILLTALLLTTACDDAGNGPADTCGAGFDQPALFAHLADNRIIPLYDDLHAKTQALQTAAQAFVQNPDIAPLLALQSAWEEAYLSYQEVTPYPFGPAEDVFLRNSVNNFPVNARQVDQNIQSGTYDLDDPAAFDKGFPALDYLLFGLGEDAATIAARYAGETGEKYRQYLTDVVDDLTARVAQTHDGWVNGGYRQTFVQNTGTAAGSSLSLLINHLNESYEITKRDRIGIPSGVVTLGFTNPTKVEAYYSGISARLALAATRASYAAYLGRGVNGADGPGLDDYLDHAGAVKNGRPLDDLIREQYEAAVQALTAVPDPLSLAVDQEPALVQTAYNELTKQVVNLKTDLPAVLCVAITYVDNPSDSD